MILIVDDDASVRTSLALLLKQNGLESRSAANPGEALQLLDRHPFELVIQDMNFSRKTTGEEGLELLRSIKQRKTELPVVLITAWGSIELAVRGVKAGAADFVTKPWSNQQLLQTLQTALGLSRVKPNKEGPLTREDLDCRFDFRNLVGRDPKFLKVLDLVGRVACTDASVLITGESGTGKELIAEALHRNSRRRNGPFVKVNLGGISSTLFESEMFGHARGAFTDARQDRKGRFEIANGGTIFLDEIGDLDLNSQVKMLRVLQDRTYEILGSSTARTVDVRVISATNRSLVEMVEKGEFREDLLYRLNLITIHLAALRERAQDVPLLATYFLSNIGNVYRRNLSVSERALKWLQGQNWPGNIRQLKHLMERTVLISGQDRLEPADFETALEMEPKESPKESLPLSGAGTMDEIEKAMIVRTLERSAGNISKAAEALGMSRQAFYRRLEKYGIQS
ncbi:MAG: sigma-54-dependent Fis family transcriptional regulator [Acidobacteria bacterium]|nr:MAG: sigma-54-dependent Fis family transcriptional regulator [Acidobacteriota bacterium]